MATEKELIDAYMAFNNGALPPEVTLERYAQLNSGGVAPNAKQLLDAFRAMNGGALPPGMTPEQAMLIDMGMDSAAIQQNPQLATILQQLAQTRLAQKTDFTQAREQVGQNYQNLTGDVENQGNAWLGDMLTRLGVDPAAAAYDPTITGYGETIANMGETADLNQATDQAWFDKMMQTYDQSLANQMTGLATGLIPLPGAVPTGGGGGGGGRGGRGGGGYRGRGYGGGGSGGDWSDPKTTDVVTETAAVDNKYYWPGYQEAILNEFSTPEELEFAQRVLDMYRDPVGVSKGVAGTELPNAEAQWDTMMAQSAQRRAYYDALPTRAADLQGQWRGLDPRAQRTREELQAAPVEAQKDFASYLNNALREVQARGAESMGERYGWQWGEGDTTLPELYRQKAQFQTQERDKERLAEAQAAASTTDPFTFEGWEGYVPNISQTAAKENAWARGILEKILGVSRDFNPNYGWNTTQMNMKDSSSTKTTQSSRAPEDQQFDNNIPDQGYIPYAEETPEPPAPPITNTLMGAGFGQNRGLSETAKNLIARRMAKAREVAEAAKQEEPSSINQAFSGQGLFGGKTSKPKRTPSRPAAKTGGRISKPTPAPVGPKVKPPTRGMSVYDRRMAEIKAKKDKKKPKNPPKKKPTRFGSSFFS